MRRIAIMLATVYCVSPTLAQETRGAIFGRVLDNQAAVIGRASVRVTNTDTNTTVPLTTNETGYYEASLLLPGNYQVSAEAPGFRTIIRRGIVLTVSSRVEINLTLEVGAVTDSVTVTAEAPLIDTSSASSGRVVDNRTQAGVPVSSSNITLFARMAPGVQSNGEVRVIGPGDQASTSDYKVAGNVGSNEWAIDGASNNGSGGRLVGYVVHSDEISEIKIETGGFDSSIGHTSGIVVAMMSKSGTNQFHGGASNIHEQTRWNATPFFTRQLYYRRIAEAEAAGDTALANELRDTPKQLSGKRNHYSGFIGGPVILPKIYDGRDRLFFFFSYVGFRRVIPPNPINFNHTFPTMANREGDFSQLLNADATRYQIYDPLSVRADESRAGHFIRTPFPGNILPRSRIMNPAYDVYKNMLPIPNNDPLSPSAEPLNNYLAVSVPWVSPYWAVTNRIDYKLSDRHRFFGRWSADDYKLLNALDWTYGTPHQGLQASLDRRANVSGVIDWVWTPTATTYFDVAVTGNQYEGGDFNEVAMNYKPSDVGMPAYMDAKAGDLHTLPHMAFAGYNPVGNYGVTTRTRWRTYALRADGTHIHGRHTLRAGFDVRSHYYAGGAPGLTSGSFSFNNAFTRRNDDTFTPAGDLGHSWAAFMMGLPSGISVASNDNFAATSPYYGWHFQDQWRVNPKLNLNLGLRMEYEGGPVERFNRIIGYFDPSLELPISSAAEAAYARNPLAERPASTFDIRGGTVYPNDNQRAIRDGELMWMPRIAAAYQWNDRTVIRAGFGMFYDTLTAAKETVNQFGFSRNTVSNPTNDFGVNWLVGDPANGISPLLDPFPVRSDGSRFDLPIRDALGSMAYAGRSFTFSPWDTKRARQRRWRIGVQRQLGASMLLEAAYAGAYSDRVYVNTNLSPLPEQYWADGMVRNNDVASRMNENVPNPFQLSNFADLSTSNPVVYQDMSTQGFYTAGTTRRNQLLRQYPHMSGLVARNSPYGEVRTDSMELSFERRFSKGFNFYVAYTRMRGDDRDVYLNEFDALPSWRESNNSRPHRIVLTGIWELPFGKGRPFVRSGPASWIVGGWQLGVAWEAQSGALLDFGNLFYYGDLDDINTGERTFDRWFNTDNFERVSARAPAAFHKRVFPTRIDGLRADPTNCWNGNVMREFKFTERVGFQVRMEALNFTNRTQFAAPDTNPLSSNFGKVTLQSQTNKRYIQLTGRITF
ncbi:MAG TPA: carboxypeptidase regulatory-like domain-containing protein [Bryobacteraceae bacterium]|nr:carboxypeptidase regulatory-like domain-containing protein [Bryobacteraceae bacterium]